MMNLIIKIIAVLMIIGGVYNSYINLLLLQSSSYLKGVLLVINIFEICLGVGLFWFKEWARSATVLLSVFYVSGFGFLGVIRGFQVGLIINIIMGLLAIIILSLPNIKNQFVK